MNPSRERLELNVEELEKLLERAKQGPLSDSDYQTLKAAVETLGYFNPAFRGPKDHHRAAAPDPIWLEQREDAHGFEDRSRAGPYSQQGELGKENERARPKRCRGLPRRRHG
jgi:hypothetical protein